MKESIQLSGREPDFRRKRSNNSYLTLILILLVAASLFLLRSVVITQDIKSPFLPTPVPTRTSNSYALEGETQFNAGSLNEAIAAYQQAVKTDPQNIQLWSELARIQTYSSALLTTDAERRTRLQEALASINAGLKLDDYNSTVHAVRAFVLDWNADPVIAGSQNQAQTYLNEGEQEALRALQIDKNNTLALAYYAEILVDQQKWAQAEQYIKQALELPEIPMDLYRVNAYVQESLGNYAEAIRFYKKASELTPNLTFLYLRTGYNYRTLRRYDEALTYFTKAVDINKQIGVKDTAPYLAIGKTYSQTGDFFSAALNVRAALKINPNKPEIYGELGVIYFKSRNYEGAIPALKCVVSGCDAKTSCAVRNRSECADPNNPAIELQGLALTPNTVVFYYTYASVLAGMHRPAEPYCKDAVPVLKQIRDTFANDSTIIGIIKPSEEICKSAGY